VLATVVFLKTSFGSRQGSSEPHYFFTRPGHVRLDLALQPSLLLLHRFSHACNYRANRGTYSTIRDEMNDNEHSPPSSPRPQPAASPQTFSMAFDFGMTRGGVQCINASGERVAFM